MTGLKHPRQPLVMVEGDTPRFKQNAIVKFLLESGVNTMSTLSLMPWSDEDRSQFAQLIGYSVGGFGELSYADPEHLAEADSLAEVMFRSRQEEPDP